MKTQIRITITGKMIRHHLGSDRGFKVRIKRDSKVYRQKNKGEKWKYCGTSATVAFDCAKKHGVEKWELESMLEFDHYMYTIESFQKQGLEKASDMKNFMKLCLNQPFDDIHRNGKVFILGTRPKEAEDALFFDNTHQNAITECLHA